MKLTTLTMAVAAACAFAQSAEARAYHHHRYTYRHEYHHYRYAYRRHEYHHHYARRHVRPRYAAELDSGYAGEAAYQGWRQWPDSYQPRRTAYRARYTRQRMAYRGGYGARPAAWCGWEMRHLVGGDPGPQYNLARNWAHWGHGGAAGVGAVVVWSHHVGKIVGRENGQWVIQSGNDGHRMRTRPRSIAGAIAIRWG
jgi:hypothetical protein